MTTPATSSSVVPAATLRLNSAKELSEYVMEGRSIPRVLICLNESNAMSSRSGVVGSDDKDIVDFVASELRRARAVEGDPLTTSSIPPISCAVWRCDGPALSDARHTLSMGDDLDAALFVIAHQQFADRLDGSEAIRRSFADMAASIVKYSAPCGAVGSSGGEASSSSLQVNVSKLLMMGKSLMSKGQSEYAEKFFLKAVGVVEAVRDSPNAAVLLEKDQKEQLDGSLVMCMSWAAIAMLVQGKLSAAEALMRLIEETDNFRSFREEPLSDAARAIAAFRMMKYSPMSWAPDTCSVKRLTETLATDANNASARCLLVVTLFLAGDVEKCITEALKLHLLRPDLDFGRLSLDAVVTFLGDGHEFVRRLGWKRTS